MVKIVAYLDRNAWDDGTHFLVLADKRAVKCYYCKKKIPKGEITPAEFISPSEWAEMYGIGRVRAVCWDCIKKHWSEKMQERAHEFYEKVKEKLEGETDG